eukprot:Skav215405  [mRNA]  locus=scaffold271:124338:124619:- [translate_table: standard]
MERFLQLHIFDKAPRCLPPYVELLNVTQTQLVRQVDDATMVRALRRAALLPWRDARFWRRAADVVAKKDPMAGRDIAQAGPGRWDMETHYMYR